MAGRQSSAAMKRNWLIWPEEHKAWWRADSQGYTSSMQQAGLYSATEAAGIVRHANAGNTFCETAVLAPIDLDALRKMKSGGR